MKPWLWLFTVLVLVGVTLGLVVQLAGSGGKIGANRPDITDLGDIETIKHPPLPGPNEPKPLAVVDETYYDFGLMDVLSDGEHSFEIRNEGEGDLVLRQGETTCKCTISSLEAGGVVPPGKKVSVKLNWTTKSGNIEDFRETAAILTNDARNPTIRFVIKGTVRSYLIVYPPVWHPEVSAAEETVQTFVFASAGPKPFKITKIESSMPDHLLKTTIKPASPKSRDRIRDLSGYLDMEHMVEVDVALQPGIRSGRFWETISFHTDIEKFDKTGKAIGIPPYNLQVQGRTVGQITFAGRDFEKDRWLVRLHNVPSSAGKNTELYMFVGGERRDINPRIKLPASPDFVKAEITPQQRAGVYKVRIGVPPGVAPCNYMGSADEQGNPIVGRVVIETDHPVEKELQLLVQFAVEQD